MTNRIIFYSLTLALLLVTGFACYTWISMPKVATVKAEKIFTEFIMTKELSSSLNKTTAARKNILDSLLLDLQVLEMKIKAGNGDKALEQRFYEHRENYERTKQGFEEDDRSQAQEYDSKIWNRINQYLKEYGKHYAVDLILPVTGEGAGIYAKEEFDVTENVLEFMNNKYAGK